jgi:hypothetical protein
LLDLQSDLDLVKFMKKRFPKCSPDRVQISVASSHVVRNVVACTADLRLFTCSIEASSAKTAQAPAARRHFRTSANETNLNNHLLLLAASRQHSLAMFKLARSSRQFASAFKGVNVSTRHRSSNPLSALANGSFPQQRRYLSIHEYRSCVKDIMVERAPCPIY